MDIIAIREAIESLEKAETTPDNVAELASLYIVYQNLNKFENNDEVQAELDDILPCYQKYCEIKRRYQLNQAIDHEVVQGMKNVCRELKEFIDTLFSHTEMHRERMLIRKMLQEVYEKHKT